MKKNLFILFFILSTAIYAQNNPARFTNGIRLPNATEQDTLARVPVMAEDGTISGFVFKADIVGGGSGTQGPKGDDGDSAYQVALDNGFVGTESEWLTSLEGADGQDGEQGIQGIQGIQGEDGADGAQGIQGEPGPDGSNGADGADGLGWTSGSYNGTTGVVTFASDDGLGFVTGDIRGEDGAQGPPGPGGSATQWRSGAGAPSDALGDDNDFYLNESNGDVYQKSAGTYSVVTNIQGADGATGAQGEQGIAGADGSDGADGLGFTGGSYNGSTGIVTITSDDGLGFTTGDLRGSDGSDGAEGNGIKSTVDNSDGTFTITFDDDTTFTTSDFTGPQGATGDDGQDGATGAQGDDGADGKTVLNGTSAPSGGTGVNGDFYIDTATNEIYGPKIGGVWGSGTSLVGPQGEQGIQGIQGVAGTDGSDGDTGPQGEQGIQGIPGNDGADGSDAAATTDASELTAGELPDARLSTNVTTEGNTFNGNSQLVKTDASGVISADLIDSEDLEEFDPTVAIQIACSDLTTDITTGTSKAYFRMPYAMTVNDVRVSLLTSGTSTGITVDINESGTTILSTKLTTDADENTSENATTAAVISDTSLADDSEITIDFDAVPTSGQGVIVTIIGEKQ